MLLEENSAFLPKARPGKSGSETYNGRDRAQNVTEYLQLWNFDAVVEPDDGNQEENRRDQNAPRWVDHAEQPPECLKEFVPQI